MKRIGDGEARAPQFRKRFDELRGNRSNTEFAQFLDMSRQTVGFYLNGDRIPDAGGLLYISEKCGVSVDWLLGKSNATDPNEAIQYISKTTGISDLAIKNLQRLNKRHKDIIEPLDKILSDDTLEFLLTNLFAVEDQWEWLLTCIGELDSAVEQGDLGEDHYWETEEKVEMCDQVFREIRQYRFEAIDIFTNIVNVISGYDEMSKRLSLSFDRWDQFNARYGTQYEGSDDDATQE